MPLDVILNELSLFRSAEWPKSIPDMLIDLLNLPAKYDEKYVFSLSELLFDGNKEVAKQYQSCIEAVRRLPRWDDKKRRILFQLNQRIEIFNIDEKAQVHFDGYLTEGLRQAFQLNSVAFSVHAPIWDSHEVPAELLHFKAPGTPSTLPIVVMHASRLDHLEQHLGWNSLTDQQRVRYLLTSRSYEHMNASEYSRGKHVKGLNNSERQLNANYPTGPGQFFASIGNKTITDVDIQDWEAQAIDLYLAETPTSQLMLNLEAKSFVIYSKLPSDIGFDGGSGAPTPWLRVEFSGRTIHSHPRTP